MDHLLSAYCLSGDRKGTELSDDDAIAAALKAPELAWLHMRADHPDTLDWIETHVDYLDTHILSALLAEETRPRAIPIDDGVMVILRGVNTNEGQDPEDMVSIRLWLDPARIISLSVRPLRSVGVLRDRIKAGQGPDTAGGFLAALIERLNERIETFLRELDDSCDALEEEVLDGAESSIRTKITRTRQKVIVFRRHIAPQRDAIGQLINAELKFISRSEQRRLMEAHDRMMRTVEDLDAMRDRLQVIKDELTNALSERLNRNLYLLSILSAIFLPLGFLTGLMGINLGGMPGAGASTAFWVFTGSLTVIAVIQFIILRFLRWI